MGQIVIVIGGIGILYGVIDLLGFVDDTDDGGWKKPVIGIVGGFAAVGIGYLMKHLGI